MPIGTSDGQQYQDQFDMLAATAGIKPQEAFKSTEGTPVPNSENNASAGSVEPLRGLINMVEQGNIDLTRRPKVKNEDGSISTVRSMSVGFDNGEVLIPTVAHDGSRILSDEEAIKQYKDSGKHLGVFKTPEDANSYAEMLHKSQEELYKDKPRSIVDKLLGTTGERYITWPEKAVRAGLGGLALPGKVASGEIDPSSSQAVEQAFELASLGVFGPGPVAAKMADGTLGSFIGVKAKTFDRNALAEAQVMKANGASVDEVFAKTGMFQGTDNRWRYELPDNEAKMNTGWYGEAKYRGRETPEGDLFSKLPEVLDHPELYKAYPELKDTTVWYNPKNTESTYFDPNSNSIVLSTQHRQNKGVLLHEITHGIQDIEGFAKGGTYSKEFKLKYDDDVEQVVKEANKLLDKDIMTPADQKRAKEINEILKKNVEYRKAGLSEAAWNYARLAGEVEARNVDTRSTMSPQQSRMLSPRWTEDTPVNQQFASPNVEFATPYGYGDPMKPPSP